MPRRPPWTDFGVGETVPPSAIRTKHKIVAQVEADLLKRVQRQNGLSRIDPERIIIGRARKPAPDHRPVGPLAELGAAFLTPFLVNPPLRFVAKAATAVAKPGQANERAGPSDGI
jgi:hypothetical protein